jgi:2-oxo-4-hydroxy-4-carboxy-5-ureidoimidazoline decarboxylase
MPLSIDEVNQLGKQQFTETLGGIFEDSPWVAGRAWHRRPFASRIHLCEMMKGEVEKASSGEQLALLRAHPDLGTRAKISSGSAVEQAGAGLDKLTEAEFARLMELNAAYRDKFGFPFLYAVKGSNKPEILEALERRLSSQREDEFSEALRQIYKIAGFRLEGLIGE